MINRKNYLIKSPNAQRSEIPNCICEACEEKRKNPPTGFPRKEESEETRRIRKYEGRRNQCGTCFEAKSKNGECAC